MKTILVFLALMCKPVPSTYTYQGTYIADLGPEIRSCGAAKRFLSETWKVRVTETGKAWVNGVRWQLVRVADDVTVLTYRANLEAHMSMDFIYSPNSAVVSLGGINVDRLPCFDMVHLRRVK